MGELKVPSRQKKARLYRKQQHIRWNWEKSPDNSDAVRYHFIVVDNKNKEGIMGKILEQFTLKSFASSLETIRFGRQGRVDDSEFRYLFETYDTLMSPRNLNLNRLGMPIKRDLNLKERIRSGYSIINYVERTYSD